MPQIGASVRARWSALVPDRSELRTAYAFESVVDEAVFIIGPVLVTVLATVVHPLAGLTCAGTAAVVGTALLVTQRRSEPPVAAGPQRHGAGPLPWRMLGPLVGCAFVMGAVLGGTEVATVAFADEQGAKPLSGLLLALWALGSMVAGIVTGAARTPASNANRFRWGMTALALLLLPLPFLHGLVLLTAFLFLSGLAVSPTLIAGFAWIEETVPPDRITEGITLFITGLGGGVAPGAALVGVVIDAAGASRSYALTGGAALLGAALAFLAVAFSGARPAPSGSSG
jgi:hypothetical protein